MDNPTLDEALRKGLEEILAKYPNGQSYDRIELILDVKHDIGKLFKKLGIDLKTPLDVYVEDGILTVAVGTFIHKN